MTDKDELRKFIKKLPRKKWVDCATIVKKLKMHRSTVWWHMDDLKEELGLESGFDKKIGDNGQGYNVRVFWKP